MYRTPRDRSVYQIGGRLAMLRKEKGYSQAEFGKEFALFCGQSRPVVLTTVSSWEQNHRQPPMQTIVQLAMFYNVSCDYLFGITDERTEKTGINAKKANKTKLTPYDVPIKQNHLVDYDGAPVYVRFKNAEHLDQWGILNYEEKIIRCKDYDISLTIKIDLYPVAELPSARTQITYLEQLISTEVVLIKMKSTDPAVCQYYNGRYQHNADRTFLVKIDNNTPLSYAGLDVCYTAYRG